MRSGLTAGTRGYPRGCPFVIPGSSITHKPIAVRPLEPQARGVIVLKIPEY